VARNMELLRWK